MKGSRQGATVAAYASLFKLRIVALLVLLAVSSTTLSAEKHPGVGRTALLVLVGMMACAGASAINNYLDRDIDSKMGRTRKRVLPQAVVAPGHALKIGVALSAVAVLIAVWLSLLTAAYVFLGAFIYVVVYTAWLKRRTSLNIVVGGLAGSCAVLAGAAAAGLGWSPAAVMLALLLFLWTPAHFWSFAIVNSEDYRAAGVPMLPVTAGKRVTALMVFMHTAGLVLIGAFLPVVADFSIGFIMASSALGLLFLVSSLVLLIKPSVPNAWRHYKGSGIYLLLLFSVLAADRIL